jgi:hypothetical protein
MCTSLYSRQYPLTTYKVEIIKLNTAINSNSYEPTSRTSTHTGQHTQDRNPKSWSISSQQNTFCPETKRATTSKTWIITLIFFMARQDLRYVQASRSHSDTTLGRTPLDEWSVRYRDYLTTYNTQDRHPSIPLVDSNPQFQPVKEAAHPRVRPHGHWDWRLTTLDCGEGKIDHGYHDASILRLVKRGVSLSFLSLHYPNNRSENSHIKLLLSRKKRCRGTSIPLHPPSYACVCAIKCTNDVTLLLDHAEFAIK